MGWAGRGAKTLLFFCKNQRWWELQACKSSLTPGSRSTAPTRHISHTNSKFLRVTTAIQTQCTAESRPLQKARKWVPATPTWGKSDPKIHFPRPPSPFCQHDTGVSAEQRNPVPAQELWAAGKRRPSGQHGASPLSGLLPALHWLSDTCGLRSWPSNRLLLLSSQLRYQMLRRKQELTATYRVILTRQEILTSTIYQIKHRPN